MQRDKILSLLGLCKRAGKLSEGTPLSEKAIKSKKSELIVIAKDISENQRKTVTDSCKYYNVKYIEYSTMNDIADYLGADGVRAVVSVNDKGFADAILDKYTD